MVTCMKMFPTFLLVISVNAMAQLQPSSFSAVYKAYQAHNESAARIAYLDGVFASQLRKSTLSESDMKSVLAYRAVECEKNVSSCFAFKSWRDLSCRTENPDSLKFGNGLWRSLFPFIKTKAHLEKVLAELSACSTKPNRAQLLIAQDLLLFLQQPLNADFFIRTTEWLSQTMSHRSLTLGEKMDLTLEMIGEAYRSKVSYLVLLSFALAPTKSITSSQIKAFTEVPAQNALLRTWADKLGDAPVAGMTTHLRNLVDRGIYTPSSSWDLRHQLFLLEIFCVHWIQNGESGTCNQKLGGFSGEKEKSFHYQIVMARIEHLQGKSAQAIARLNSLLAQTSLPEASALMKWVYFGLSQYHDSRTNRAEIEKYIELFARNLGSGDGNTWLSVLPITRRQTLLLDLDKCADSIQKATEARQVLERKVTEPIAEHAWINFFELLCQARLGNKEQAAVLLKRLSEEVRLMPDMVVWRDLGEVVLAKLNGKPTDKMAAVRAKLGPDHPELRRAEALLALLK